jgi:hypothetical protein
LGNDGINEAEAALTEAESFYAKQPQPKPETLGMTLMDIFLHIHKALNQPESPIGSRPTAKE